LPDSARKAGTLFVVATPMGDLSDMTFRAVETLSGVDLIAAEDTRHSRHLLTKYSISTPLLAYHEHNERQQTGKLVDMLLAGKSVALISDAGTPLISDPGFPLLQAAQAQGVRVVPIPGCCAAIAALSASGLPVERFVFEGFPPARSAGRLRKFESLAGETRTIIFYESSHRVTASLSDMIQVFGPGRQAALAREITKQFETIVNAELSRLLEFVTGDANQQKGEFVIMLHGAEEKKGNDLLIILGPLMNALSLKQAVELTVEITGCPRNEVYTEALKLKN